MLSVALLIESGCASSAGAPRPAWIPRPNRAHPDVLYITGSCRGALSRATARRCAIADADRQVANELGDAARQRLGQYVEAEHEERTAGRFDHYLLIAYPRKALAQAQRRAAGRVMLAFACRADTAGACRDSDAGLIEQALSKAGLTAAPQRLSSIELNSALRQAEQAKAAHLLLAEASAKFASESEGEFFAEARCGYRLLNAVDGKVVASFESGPIKGGHIDRPASVRRAIENCLDSLTVNAAKLPTDGIQ